MTAYRIVLGGIRQETNTFSPLQTELADFEIGRGQVLLAETFGSDWPDVDLRPTFVANALPGGLVKQQAYLALKDELLAELAAVLPVDGVCLDLHGAMEVESIGDGEGDLVAAVRALVGDEVLISISLDLHANVSSRLVEQADIITAFRTAPHRDHAETCRRALQLLLKALRHGLKPAMALLKPPLLLSGEQAVTDRGPARALYARLAEIDAKPGILNASLIIGCAWTDSAFTSTSVIVVAESDQELAHRQAVTLAEALWRQRAHFDFGVETVPVDEAIRLALASEQRPVFISDSGDNVTAGAVGDSPLMVARLLALGAQEALVAGLHEPAAVQTCRRAGSGGTVSLTFGQTQSDYQAFTVTGEVQALTSDFDGNPSIALVHFDGVTIILTAHRQAFITLAAMAEAGVDPLQYQTVVVKQGYLFPDLARYAPRAIMALSPGSSSLDLASLPYRHLSRPIYPLDHVDWQPE